MPFLDCFRCHCDKQETVIHMPAAPKIKTRMLYVQGFSDLREPPVRTEEVIVLEEPLPPGSRRIVVMSKSSKPTVYRGN